jgi:serine/threonine-protein kinase HipA
MRALAAADVFREGMRVGTITRTQRGSVFEYEERFFEEHRDRPGGIAVHLPYSMRRIETSGVNLHTFFAGLLPEGLRLRALVRRLKTSDDDLFTLLIASGADTVGDLAAVPAGASLVDASPRADVRRLEDVSFQELFEESVAGAGEGPEPTIPGVQEKISAGMISFPISSSRARKAYVLKLNPKDKPRLVENEHFFMRMASACGLAVPRTMLVRDRGGEMGLLVERFDRVWSSEARRLVRVHQEDACQFLDRYPADKYRLTCRDIADGLRVCAAPVAETLRFLRLVAFSYLIANGDLHAKNVSIVHDPKAKGFRLSPGYDLLSTLPYGDRTMALGLEGRQANLKRKHFVVFGARQGVRESAVAAMLDALDEAAAPWIDRLDEVGLDAKKTKHLRVTMEQRRADLR